MSARQISDAIQEDFSSVSKALKMMIKYDEIRFIEFDRHTSCKLLGANHVSRRMRFFYNTQYKEKDIIKLLDRKLKELHSI